MEQTITCKEALSKARDIAKHTIDNLHEDLEADDIMTQAEATALYKSVMIIIEVGRIIGDKDV